MLNSISDYLFPSFEGVNLFEGVDENEIAKELEGHYIDKQAPTQNNVAKAPIAESDPIREFTVITSDEVDSSKMDQPALGIRGKLTRVAQKVRSLAVEFLGDVLATGFGKWWDKAGKESTSEAVGELAQEMIQESWFSCFFSSNK